MNKNKIIKLKMGNKTYDCPILKAYDKTYIVSFPVNKKKNVILQVCRTSKNIVRETTDKVFVSI